MGVEGGSGGGGDIALDFEALQTIGRNTSDDAAQALTARDKVDGTRGEHGMYGSYPAAQELAAHHDAVAGVFTQTLQALSQEMEELGQAISQSSTRYADADEGIQSALTSIVSRLSSSQATTTEANRSARLDAGDDLMTEESAALDEQTLATASADAEASEWDVLSGALQEVSGDDQLAGPATVPETGPDVVQPASTGGGSTHDTQLR